MRNVLGIIVLAASVALAGCLQKDTTHTLYLSPDGRLSWLAIEKDVRSDEADAARRHAEEQGYITSASADSHGVARGLAALDPVRLRTQILRAERPFVVTTEAEFSSLAFMVQRLLKQIDLEADVIETREGAVTTLVVRIDAVGGGKREGGPDTPVEALAEDLERYRFRMTEGRFIAATGFKLADSGAEAIPVEIPWQTILDNGGILELSLTWTR